MGSQPATTTQTNTVKLSPEQQQIFNSAMPYISQYAHSALPTLPTSTIASFNPNEIAAQSGAINAATGAGTTLGTNAAAANNFLMNPSILSPDSNPWLKQSGDAVTQSMTQNLLETIMPGLRSGASVAGGPYSGGSSREGIAGGLATGRTQQAIGSSLSDLYSKAYGQGLDAMKSGLQLAPITQQGLLFGPNVQGQVGGQQRAMDQAQLDSSNSLAQLQQMLPFLRAQDLLSLVSGMPGGTGVSTVTGAQPGTSPISGALGGAASGAALGSVIPGLGTGFGAVGGGLAGLLGSLFHI